MDLLSRVFFSGFTLLRAFLSAQKSAQGPTQPLWIFPSNAILFIVQMWNWRSEIPRGCQWPSGVGEGVRWESK